MMVVLVITHDHVLGQVAMKKKKLKLSMTTFLRFRAQSEMKHRRSCGACGKRFSEQDMVWIDTQGWLCNDCQKKIA